MKHQLPVSSNGFLVQRHSSFSLLAILLLSILSGCASLVLTSVSKENRDITGKVNGTYTITQHKAALKQNIEKWIFTCPSMRQERQYTMFVLNGKVNIYGTGAKPLDTYADSSGKFRAEYPLSGVAKESALSSESITSGKRTLIIRGHVNPSKTSSGLITVGIAQFGNAGCSARLTIKKQ